MRLLKRKSLTSGLSIEDEVKAWSVFFSYGHDFFNDLKVLGIPSFQKDHEAAGKMAGEAWHRLGSAFMKAWIPNPSKRTPWALTEFGEPEE